MCTLFVINYKMQKPFYFSSLYPIISIVFITPANKTLKNHHGNLNDHRHKEADACILLSFLSLPHKASEFCSLLDMSVIAALSSPAVAWVVAERRPSGGAQGDLS